MLVIATFALLALGGTVTSRGAGLAVPDWPRSFGHNMFLLPASMWTGGAFWEHTHRLLASLVGLLTIGMCWWLIVAQRSRRWLRWTGLAALALVIVQGVMGGLRVTELSVSLAIVHGIAAQVFLCLTILIAAATSRYWTERSTSVNPTTADAARGVRRACVILIAVLLAQLALGSIIRHTGSGLAIPDFPASYGRAVPPMTEAGIRRAINDMPYDHFVAYFTPFQIGVHFAHRCWALVVVGVSLWAMTKINRALPGRRRLAVPMLGLAALLIAQVALGALVIWTGRHPELATAHQVTGAAILATAALLTFRVHRFTPSADAPRRSTTQPTAPAWREVASA